MKTVITLMLALAASGAAAKDQKIVCPEELSAIAVQVSQPPPGWSGYVPARFLLQAAGVTLGPLEHRAVQLGEHHELGKKRFKMVYPHLKDWKGEKWVTCEYGMGAGLVLGRRLPDNTAQCIMVYTPDERGVNSIDITCG